MEKDIGNNIFILLTHYVHIHYFVIVVNCQEGEGVKKGLLSNFTKLFRVI